MADEQSKVTPEMIEAGDTYLVEGDDYYRAGINVDGHFNRIECFGKNEADAEALRDQVLLAMQSTQPEAPIPMMLFCPKCGLQHVDAPDERTPDWDNPPHRSHLCHGCGCIWRPADVPTEGVAAIQTRGSKDTVFYNAAAKAQPEAPLMVTDIAKAMRVAVGKAYEAGLISEWPCALKDEELEVLAGAALAALNTPLIITNEVVKRAAKAIQEAIGDSSRSAESYKQEALAALTSLTSKTATKS